MWDDTRGGLWTRVEGPGRPHPDDRHGDGLSQYARDLALDRPMALPAPEQPRLRVVQPVQEAPQQAQQPEMAPTPQGDGFDPQRHADLRSRAALSIRPRRLPRPVVDDVSGIRLLVRALRSRIDGGERDE